MIQIHKWKNEKAGNAREAFGLRKKKCCKDESQRRCKKRIYKRRICPYDLCGKVVVRLENHLKAYHTLEGNTYREYLKKALHALEECTEESETTDDIDSDAEKRMEKEQLFEDINIERACMRTPFIMPDQIHLSEESHEEVQDSEEFLSLDKSDSDWVERHILESRSTLIIFS